MDSSLIECIPNFSEGRRLEIIDQISQAIQISSHIYILDKHSDPDHNRTVVTFVGPPRDVLEAAFQAIKKAAELINLDQHTGSHPRLGAADVVPLIPISGVSMEETVQLARELGKRVASDLSIPVFLYEEAALKSERIRLENIRKGEYELLKQEITTNPDRSPDFGPCEVTTAGATIIGARSPLIAYNIYLNSSEIKYANDIAKKIRESSGGLPYVKALGMLVNGFAQISMNLTNYKKTSIFRVFNEIDKYSSELKIPIHHSELVGLIPQEALEKVSVEYLKLTGFNVNQILEKRIYSLPSMTKDNESVFLDNLASKHPSPGGGSASAYAGAMAAALISMVANLSIGKKKYLENEPQLREILLQSEKIRHQLVDYVEKDAKGFEEVMNSFKLPRNSPDLEEIRLLAIEKATQNATLIPLEIAQLSLMLLALAERVAFLGNNNAISDAGSAGSMAIASITAALLNVKVNISNLTTQSFIDEVQSKINQIEGKLPSLEGELKNTMLNIGGF